MKMMLMKFYFTFTVAFAASKINALPPPTPADTWEGCLNMGNIENIIKQRCGEDTEYFKTHCIKTCTEYRVARKDPAVVGASCEKDYQCDTNMCYNKKCATSEGDDQGNCRYHATAYGHCEKGGEYECTKERTILKTNFIKPRVGCSVKGSVQKLSCQCTERLAIGTICEKSRQCASEVCYSKTKKCVESTQVGNCMYHLGEPGKCKRINESCGMHRKIEARGSYNQKKSNEEGGCQRTGDNYSELCNCDGHRIQEGSACAAGSYCSSDVCKNKSCVSSFKHKGCAFSFASWGKCEPDAKTKNICKQRRIVDGLGFVTKSKCHSSSVSDKLEQACTCPATPANNECKERTTKNGKKYYYNTSANLSAWSKAECLKLKKALLI